MRHDALGTERRIQQIERDLAQMPLWPVGGGAEVEVHVLSSLNGTDTIYDSGALTITGIGVDQVTEVPAASPSLASPVAGLGTATLDGGSTVWVATYADGERDMTGYVPDGHTAIARRSVAIPITDDPDGATAPVWLIWRV